MKILHFFATLGRPFIKIMLEMKSSSVYRTVLLIEKKLKAQQILKTLVCNAISGMF